MRKSLLTLLTFLLCFGTNSYAQDFVVRDEKICVLTEILQKYSNHELLERMEYLISHLEVDEHQDNTPELDPVSRSEIISLDTQHAFLKEIEFSTKKTFFLTKTQNRHWLLLPWLIDTLLEMVRRKYWIYRKTFKKYWNF